MSRMMIALAGAVVCAGMAYGAGTESLTLAAQDTSKIPEIVKALEGQKGSDFAADVMNAIATMPGNPTKKVKKLTAAAEAFLGVVGEGELSSLFANLTANVPFTSLPAWVDLFKPSVDAFIKELDNEPYNKLVNDVLQKINALGETSDADKTVISAFAIKLLARYKAGNEQTEWLNALKLPAAYAEQVKAAMPGVFAGNYDSVLGPDAKIVESDKIRLVTPDFDLKYEKSYLLNTAAEFGMDAIDSADDRTGIQRPEPLVIPEDKGGKDKKKDEKKKPPVPKPYKGQM